MSGLNYSLQRETRDERVNGKRPYEWHTTQPEAKKKKKKVNFTIDDLEIKPLETAKDKIKQPLLATAEYNMLIPPIGSSVIISGKSGSGKSTLLARLLTEKQFYKGFFDEIFIFSPTANSDDIQKQMGIDPDNVFTDLKEAIELLEVIQDKQKAALSSKKANKVPQFCVIFDDIIGDKQFMNTKQFTKMFYQVRHLNCTTFLCTQHFRRVPVVCRNQANFIFFFAGSRREVEVVAEEYAPPGWKDREFVELVDWATSEDFGFFTINMKVSPDIRFRKKLYMLLPMNVSREEAQPSEAEKTNSLTQTAFGVKNAGDEKGSESTPVARSGIGGSSTRKETSGKGSRFGSSD